MRNTVVLGCFLGVFSGGIDSLPRQRRSGIGGGVCIR